MARVVVCRGSIAPLSRALIPLASDGCPSLIAIRSARGTQHMSGAIAWQVELAIRPGELDTFRTLTREMVESTQGERGVLIYERFVSEDGTVVYVYERYADSAAAVAHLLTFAHKY